MVEAFSTLRYTIVRILQNLLEYIFLFSDIVYRRITMEFQKHALLEPNGIVNFYHWNIFIMWFLCSFSFIYFLLQFMFNGVKRLQSFSGQKCQRFSGIWLRVVKFKKN